jgi:carbamoyl-phosphate synthase small subunit
MMMIASTVVSDKGELKALLEAAPRIEEINYIEEVSTKVAYTHTNGVYDPFSFRYNDAPVAKARIAAIDFGVKRNILNELTQAGLEVEVLPNTFSGDDLIARYDAKEIDGVFLSNGPGDPLVLKGEQEEIKKLIARKIPLFGICLGHQLLSIAHGYDTHKLKFGHH